MKKSVFLGEMPVWFLGPYLTSKVAYNHLTDGCLIAEIPQITCFSVINFMQFNIQEQMDKIFMINGFRVELNSFEEVAKHFNRNLLSVDNKNALFFAEQLQLSDDQVVQLVMTANGYLLFGIKNSRS